MLLILFLYMLLASTFTLGKAVLFYTQPIFFIGVRMTLAGLILLAYSYGRKKTLWRFERKDSWLFLQIIVLHIYAAYIFEYVALEHVSSSKACLFYSLSPFLTALYSYFFFSERLTKRQWRGLALGFSGFLPVLLATSSEQSSVLWVSFSELLLLLSVISSVQGWIVVKRLLKKGYSPTMINGTGMLSGGILALITSWVVEDTFLKVPTSMADSLMMFFFYTFLLIIIANVIFYNLYGYLMHRYSATFLSFAGFTSPLFAALYGRVFLGEAIKPWFFISVGIIGVGLYIFYQEELKRVKIV